jgi:branched-chain amino acid transport system permease protein
MVLLPILLDRLGAAFFAGSVDPGKLENLQKVIFGALIVVTLIRQPEGLARLLRGLRAQARAWPLRP